MLQEIEAAVTFLTRLVAKSVDPGGSTSSKSSNSNNTINNNSSKSDHSKNNRLLLTEDKIQEFSRKLQTILQNRFRNHWYPEKPTKGQAFRCIRINQNCKVDTSIEQACNECGFSYEMLRLPVELTLWIDPNEVTCRFGEHKGSYCIVAKLRDGRQENYVDQINIDELEQRSLERSKQSSFDIVHSRKKRQALLAHRSKNSPISLFNSGNGANGPSYHGHHQSMNGSLVNGTGHGSMGTTSSAHSHPGVPVTSTTAMNGGYVDYSANGLLPTTSANGPNMQQQYHQNHFGTQQQQAHFYANSAQFHQTHQVVAAAQQHSNHYGSPTSHLYTKYNHLAMSPQSQQQGPSPNQQPGPLVGARGLMAPSLSDYQTMDKDNRRHLTTAAASATIVTNRF